MLWTPRLVSEVSLSTWHYSQGRGVEPPGEASLNYHCFLNRESPFPGDTFNGQKHTRAKREKVHLIFSPNLCLGDQCQNPVHLEIKMCLFIVIIIKFNNFISTCQKEIDVTVMSSGQLKPLSHYRNVYTHPHVPV